MPSALQAGRKKTPGNPRPLHHKRRNQALELLDPKAKADLPALKGRSHPANAADGAREDRKVKDVVPAGPVDLGATSAVPART